MSNRIRLVSADLRRGGGLQAAVGRAKLDRYTSAWRPKPRQRQTLLSTSLKDDPTVPATLRGPSLRLKARGFTIPEGDTNSEKAIGASQHVLDEDGLHFRLETFANPVVHFHQGRRNRSERFANIVKQPEASRAGSVVCIQQSQNRPSIKDQSHHCTAGRSSRSTLS